MIFRHHLVIARDGAIFFYKSRLLSFHFVKWLALINFLDILIMPTLNELLSFSYHHIPSQIQSFIISLYKDLRMSIIADQFHASTLSVRRGVLQGDCLSPLLFNLCFYTFIHYIKAENTTSLDFIPTTATTVCFSQYTGFSLLTMLQVLLVGKGKSAFCLTVSPDGIIGPNSSLGLTNA